ncbi:cell death-inducing p53-target protein 1 homolog [Labrus bergylta]|uniref:Cell death-inducing p53-target protein 1 homolog n=1 Tax=Labrus bergylta TaxID=56723 RepID=A0A3Q3FEY1_9LABR|nr:cell death-inducing p53-target protein 1 homolog [Labrus bergylta]XP_020512085.1 cell death-inducing p53-target protein 1 homolog [Labrus bergylta]XP_020516780.1 cell death-inducing p53-target protein 1 homolog [Labrus bergylta]
MEKGYPPQESAPPYPGPPLNYGGAAPQPEMYPQPGMCPQPGFYPTAPPAGYQAGVPYAPPAPAATVTHLVVTAGLHDSPGQALCPHCQQTVVTVTHHTAGLMTWGICAGLTFFGCFLCCFLPFCIESCKDVEHRCPTCHKVIYIFKRW